MKDFSFFPLCKCHLEPCRLFQRSAAQYFPFYEIQPLLTVQNWHYLNKHAFMLVSVVSIHNYRIYIFMWYMLYKTNVLITTVMWSCCACKNGSQHSWKQNVCTVQKTYSLCCSVMLISLKSEYIYSHVCSKGLTLVLHQPELKWLADYLISQSRHSNQQLLY